MYLPALAASIHHLRRRPFFRLSLLIPIIIGVPNLMPLSRVISQTHGRFRVAIGQFRYSCLACETIEIAYLTKYTLLKVDLCEPFT